MELAFQTEACNGLLRSLGLFVKLNLHANLIRTAAIGWIFLLGFFSVLVANAEEPYKVQTAFIYQFTNYITWPAESIGETFLITVVGASPLTQELENLAKTKTAQGKKIEISEVSEISLLKKSRIVILGKSNERVLEEVKKKTRGSGALIISFGNGLAEKGAMINFYLDDGKLRFEMNRSALEQEKIQVSSQLLKLARLVE
jgi:hypothetical protein